MKRTAEFVLGLIGGICGILAALLGWTMGGIGSLFHAGGAASISSLSTFAFLASVVGIVGASIVNRTSSIGGALMIIAAITGFISVSFFYILAGTLLLIGGIMALVRHKGEEKEKKGFVARHPILLIITVLAIVIIVMISNIPEESETAEEPASAQTGAVAEEKIVEEKVAEEQPRAPLVATPQAPPKVIEKKYSMNQNIKVDYLTYKVMKAETFTKMGTSFISEETKGKFIKVHLTITNDAKESKYIFSPRFKIVDSKGRQFDEFPGYSMYIADPLDFGQQLQPGLSVEGAVVFEMPKDATELKLNISGDWVSVSSVVVSLSGIRDIGTDTTLEDKNNKEMEELTNKCSAPFKCSSTCAQYADIGKKDCLAGKLCCME